MASLSPEGKAETELWNVSAIGYDLVQRKETHGVSQDAPEVGFELSSVVVWGNLCVWVSWCGRPNLNCCFLMCTVRLVRTHECCCQRRDTLLTRSAFPDLASL